MWHCYDDVWCAIIDIADLHLVWAQARLSFDSEFKRCLKVVVITILTQVFNSIISMYGSCLKDVVWHWLSIHVGKASCFLFDSYAICLRKSVSQSVNWNTVLNICDNEASSQSCFIIVFKKYFIFLYEILFLQDIDLALTSVIVWPHYMISEYHTQMIFRKNNSHYICNLCWEPIKQV